MPSQKKVKELLRLSGKVRGDVLKSDYKYVLEKQGRKDFDKLDQEAKKIKKELGYHKLSNIGWYPIGWKGVIMELNKELFNWKGEDFYNLGRSASSNSFLTKAVLRYFSSLEKNLQEIPQYWKKYWGVGELELYEKNWEKNYLILRLKDFKIHPDLCFYLRGHFRSFGELLLNTKVSVEEKKCPYKQKSNSFHEFVVKW